jgi:cytochrome c-type biogenesis protein CcmE
MSKGAQIAGGATAIALLLAWYAATNLEADASFSYYQDLATFLAAPSERVGEPSRVHGYVAQGSIERDVAARAVRFRVQGAPPHAGAAGGETLPVVFTSLETPDLFKDGAEVVVEGRLAEAAPAVFHADKVMAKCPSKFAAADRQSATP